MNRRDLIKGIGAVICAGAVPTFIPRLLPQPTLQDAYDNAKQPLILSSGQYTGIIHGGVVSLHADGKHFDITEGTILINGVHHVLSAQTFLPHSKLSDIY